MRCDEMRSDAIRCNQSDPSQSDAISPIRRNQMQSVRSVAIRCNQSDPSHTFREPSYPALTSSASAPVSLVAASA